MSIKKEKVIWLYDDCHHGYFKNDEGDFVVCSLQYSCNFGIIETSFVSKNIVDVADLCALLQFLKQRTPKIKFSHKDLVFEAMRSYYKVKMGKTVFFYEYPPDDQLDLFIKDCDDYFKNN